MPGEPGAVLYVAQGAALVPWAADAKALSLSPLAGVTLPAAVQYVWFHPRLPLLYAAYSARASGGDTHGVTAFGIGPDGLLALFGPPVPLGNRPIHVTADPEGRFLLLACNIPPQVLVHRLAPDGAIGLAVKQDPDLRLGHYPHQARVLPDGRQVVLCCRGSDPVGDRPAEPGALVVLALEDGRLSWLREVTQGDGLAFGPRHVDLHPARSRLYAVLERGNRLLTYALDDDGPAAPPLAEAPTLPEGAHRLAPEQYAGPVHVHPSGHRVYAANRSDGTVPFAGGMVHVGGGNSIATFDIDPETGAARLEGVVDTQGIHCRSFALHPSGGMLVAASVAPLAVRDGEGARVVTAGLSVFALDAAGQPRFIRKYDAEPLAGPLFWCGFRRLG